MEEYENYYKNLLRTKTAKTRVEKQAEERVEKQFNTIIEEATTIRREKITEEMVQKEVMKLKKNKARDRLGWKNEWIKEGGKEMIRSLTTIYNRIEEENMIPEQWNYTTVKSVNKNGLSQLSESQRGLFLANIISKLYERIKKTQNEKFHTNMSQMQTAGRKKRSATDNILIMSAIIEQRREEKKNTYTYFADAVKCFDKLWLKDSLLELKEIGYKSNDIKMLYEMNRQANITISAPFGETREIGIEEVVKQGTIYGPIMCCATTAKVNTIGEKVTHKYRNIEIGMPVYMDDISAVGEAEEIRKGIRNCRKMEEQKKFEYGLKKTKIMTIRTGKEAVEKIEVTLSQGKVQEVEKYKYLGITMNKEGNLQEHIREMEKKAVRISNEINAIGARRQVGTEEVRVKLKLFETCLMPAILHALEAWGRILKGEQQEIEKIQGKALGQILQLPMSTPYIGMLMETGIWPAKERIDYSSMMLYHNIVNSDGERTVKKLVKEQEQHNMPQTLHSRVAKIALELGVDIKDAEVLKKSAWKKRVKDRIKWKIQEQLQHEMENKTKSRTICKDQWKRKEYIEICKGDIAKDVMKIRLHMWDLKMNYKRKDEENMCPLCNKAEDTTEHVLECAKQNI